MAQCMTVAIPHKTILEAKKLRDELDSLIETAEILNNRLLTHSIRKSEEDVRSGQIIRIQSEKELNNYFKR
ncbi:MAG: hypothetical protein V1777_00135 [Candidatus Micrarchaeota archaeon]